VCHAEPSVRTALLAQQRGCLMQWEPTLRLPILREQWRASRLPSLRSALRGLDPRHALPIVSAFIGASARAEANLDHAASQRQPGVRVPQRSGAMPALTSACLCG
jgi:hypothetical protein